MNMTTQVRPTTIRLITVNQPIHIAIGACRPAEGMKGSVARGLELEQAGAAKTTPTAAGATLSRWVVRPGMGGLVIYGTSAG